MPNAKPPEELKEVELQVTKEGIKLVGWTAEGTTVTATIQPLQLRVALDALDDLKK